MVLPTINNELNFLRKLITIDGSNVTSETSIPLGLNVNLPGVHSTGKDVRLAKLDGTPIAREIECVGVPNAEDVMIWYPFDTVSATNSQFWVYWGNTALTEPAANSTYGNKAVWDSSHVMVQLMNDDPDGDVPNSIKDSTGVNDLTPYGSMASADLIALNYGKAITFDGSNDVIKTTSLSGFPTATNPYTLETIVRIDDAETAWRSIFHIKGSTNKFVEFRTVGSKFRANIYVAPDIYVESISTYSTSNIYHLFHVFDGSKVYLWVNGVNQNPSGATVTPNYEAPTILRISIKYSEIDCLEQTVELIKLYNTTISNNYIATLTKNAKNPTASGTTPFYLSFSEPMHQRRTAQFM